MVKNRALSKKDNRQLLIEKAEFSSKASMPVELKESLDMSTTNIGTLIVKNIPSTILNRENQNGRIYSTEVVQAALDEAKQLKLFEQKSLLSQADEHPESSFVAPSHASHVVINAYIKPNVRIVVEGQEEVQDVLFMDWEVLNTQEGKNLRALFEADCSFGVSIRGVGSMKGKYVDDYSICGADCVGLPSSSTYTGTQVSESVDFEYRNANKDELKETFNVSTSSTNVVRDLDAAAQIQAQLMDIGYGTVTKTSTKVDEETDPKTGAQTSITTLEAETSDDVADLDQALMMAKNAMLNGTVNVDSITIENIKEEEPKESVEANVEDSLNEDENQAVEYVPLESNMTEATKEKSEEDERVKGKKFVLKTPNGFVAMDGNTLVFKDDPKEALHFIAGKEESGLVHLSGVEKILDAMGVFDVEKYYRRDLTDISAKDEEEPTTKDEGIVGGIVGGIGGAAAGGTLAGPLGALSGAASGYSLGSDISDDLFGDEEKTESNLLDGTPANPIQGQEKVNAPLTEDNGSNTRYVAQVTVNSQNGASESNTIPVSGVEQEAILNELSNLWKQKAENGNDEVRIVLVDTQDNSQYLYNPSNNSLQPFDAEGAISDTFPRDFVQNEAVDPIEQDKNKLTVNVDKDVSVEKEFDSPIQASVAKAGMEKGKIPSDIMLEDGRYVLEFDFIYEMFSKIVPYDLYFKGNTDETVNLLLQDLKKLEERGLIWNYYLEGDFVVVNGLSEGKANTLLNTLRKNGFKIVNKDFPELHKMDESESTLKSDDLYNVLNYIVDHSEKLSNMQFKKFNTLCNKVKAKKADINDVKAFADACGLHGWRDLDISYDEDIEEAAIQYEDIKPGWYVASPNIGISGPFASKAEAISGLEPYMDKISVEYISDEDIHEAALTEDNDSFFTYNTPEEYFSYFKTNSDILLPNYKTDINTLYKKYNKHELNQLFVMDALQKILNKVNPKNDMSERLYNNAGEPSDDFVGKPITETEENIKAVLTNLDWDVDSIVNNFTANAQEDDIATMGDLESLIRDLPDTITINIPESKLNAIDNATDVKALILDMANKQTGLVLKNATISSIE